MRRLIVLVAILTSGCAADESARDLSRVTLSQVVAYEDSIRKLSRDLNSNYQTTADHLAVNLQESARLNQNRSRRTDAQSAATAALQEGRLTLPMIRDFLAAEVKKDEDRKALVNADIAALRAAQKQVMAEVQVKEDRLKGIREKLEHLQADPGWTSYLDRLKPLYDAVKTAADKPSEEEAQP